MKNIINFDKFPINCPESASYQALIRQCRKDLASEGLFSLEHFLAPGATLKSVAEVGPVLQTQAFEHKRLHNIYFRTDIPGLASDHPALGLCETINHTVCADQILGSLLIRLYEYPLFAGFIADVTDTAEQYTMADPLARVNVMAYRNGEALNWHFDRAEFTTTLLLQAPDQGGAFEYRSDLRSDTDPNFDGVARLLHGEDPNVRVIDLSAGTLNVFRGKNTAHRVTPVRGPRDRIVAVFSYYERPGVVMSEDEQRGFYGRAS